MFDSQMPILIVLLVMGAGAKVVTVYRGGEPGTLSRLGPAVLMPGRMQAPSLLVCAVVELVLAGGLLFTTAPIFRWGTVGFFAMCTYVLVELRRRRPDAGCGCFGEVSSAPVGIRSIGRTVVLTGMSALSVAAPASGWAATVHPTWLTAAGLAVIALLSPEIEELVDRVRYRAPCEQRPGPTEQVMLSRLRSSGPWRAHQEALTSPEPYDSWRELCWRFFVFTGRDQDDVVFAVHLSGRRPAVRVAVVSNDDSDSLPEYTPVSA
ncbi:MauE/DoxX family redox-associated membrane protein [Nonomuraea sp. NPDC051191]|uniref:MauE/DoxX family redox-associated membrane protein n=1 Tax=Nonomuraea sp. NPDC051191 TaxID=3364372 RepID=UPI003796E518